MDSKVEELLCGGGRLAQGFRLQTWNAEAEAAMRFPGKPYCLVRQWIVNDVEADDDYKASLAADGLLNQIVCARDVVMHSTGERQCGDWVRSTFQRSFTDGYLFESVNTLCVLMGGGIYRKASARAVLEIGGGAGRLLRQLASDTNS